MRKRLATLFTPALSLATVACMGAAPNILLICVDDLRPELGCYGVDYIQTPRIDELASSSRLFRRHYVQAPTCGASRYALLTGNYGPYDNDAILKRAEQLRQAPDSLTPSMPAWFRSNGYTTVAVGKVSHYPGGLAGDDWADPEKPELPYGWDRSLMPVGSWQHPRGAMHGLANGEIRENASEMDVYQSFDGDDRSYPDGLITDAALEEMRRLAREEKPFLLAVGLIRPHLPFGAPTAYMEPYRELELPPVPHPEKPQPPSTWHGSGEFMKYNRWGKDPRKDPDFAQETRRHYAACVTYADAQVGRILDQLELLGLEEDTIVALWGDHGWHLGEHEVWGKHTLFEESLRAPLIISVPNLQQPGAATDAIVETIDLYPTLCELSGLPSPPGLDGASLASQLADPEAPGSYAISYGKKAATIRSATHRLTIHEDGAVELYDHDTPEAETRNRAAESPSLVSQLRKLLEEELD